MSLVCGMRLGPYEIAAPLGAGGMGEVYRARDTRLDRDVAIKVLPEPLGRDRERLLRFEREAKLLASLNHPNIAQIYGFETDARAADFSPRGAAEGEAPSESDEQRRLKPAAQSRVHFLVLEYVEGETLAARLKRGALPVGEALELCRQIAEALEAAHEKGVIHRDLKPGNVMVKPDGTVKVLDFGLARALGGDASGTDLAHSPTLTAEHTAKGVVLGTAAYMSPEQARGKLLDKRSDIWSFGCVLYEALIGRRAFEGETSSDLIARILERDPDWAALPANTPPGVRALLHRCLEKDRNHRLRDIGDARLELEEAGQTRAWSGTGMPAATLAPTSDKGRFRRSAAAALLVIAGMAAGAGLWHWLRPLVMPPQEADRPQRVLRLCVGFPPQLKPENPVLSPDGRTLAFIARPADAPASEQPVSHIYTRPQDRYDVAQVKGSEGAISLAFSPDSRWMAFVAPLSPTTTRKKLSKVAVDGSAPPLTLTDWQDEWNPRVCWLPDGDILILADSGKAFLRVASEGGTISPKTRINIPDFDGGLFRSRALPGGKAALLTGSDYYERGWHSVIALLDLESGAGRILITDGGFPVCFPEGVLLFSRGDVLLAVPFDAGRRELAGGPMAIMDGLRTTSTWDDAWFDVSTDGTLVYAPGGRAGGRRRIVFVDGEGNVEPWSQERRAFESRVAHSPDGRQLAVVVASADGLYEIWVSEVDDPRLRRLASAADADCSLPLWSPDGQRIVYLRMARDRLDGLYLCRADGSDEPERLLASESPEEFLAPVAWSPDGSSLLIVRGTMPKGDLCLLPLVPGEDGTRRPRPLLATDFNESFASLSADGRWIAYGSDESGLHEVYVVPYGPGVPVGRPLRVSVGGGRFPQWAADGKTLFYSTQREQIMAVAFTAEPALSASAPRLALDLSSVRGAMAAVAPDGRFVVIQKGEEEDEITRCHVVLNWLDEVRTRLASAGKR